jgi:hypothetical protein
VTQTLYAHINKRKKPNNFNTYGLPTPYDRITECEQALAQVINNGDGELQVSLLPYFSLLCTKPHKQKEKIYS